MRLTYNSVYDLADFQKIDHVMPTEKESKAYLKPQYFKTYYCVLELKMNYYSTHDCGLMSKENKWYDKGYYVVPCYLSAHKWFCGDKIVLHYRKFCYTFGELRDYEPHDVPKEKWWIARDFKQYWGLVQSSLGHFGYIESYELYDDVHEAIARAKELDKRLNIKEEYNNANNTLKNAIYAHRQLRSKLNGRELSPTTQRKKLMREIALITQDKREAQIKKLISKVDILRIKMNKIVKYNNFK